ncbi:MAG: putative toxin-antitoxin system toxin component, PIN family [Chloroflexota bacterium]|nr:putative toxin-antitoxin system toxin component, PIN family [Chloroflexota bacterium]
MREYQIVIDTNIFFSALYSQRGASYKLISLINSGKFSSNVSVPLILEYEDVAKRNLDKISPSEQDVDDIIDYLCKIANRQKIFYLWRPFLRDPKDDMVLELAVASRCHFIITFNMRDFQGVKEDFGIGVITPKEFLQKIGEIE